MSKLDDRKKEIGKRRKWKGKSGKWKVERERGKEKKNPVDPVILSKYFIN
ncbi:MAG: hypothetical protein H8E57_02640 [Candidatus Cloacimonetes bacterium]|nr:hypothetical protein [Candidatus Cloacimonadota bacterium]